MPAGACRLGVVDDSGQGTGMAVNSGIIPRGVFVMKLGVLMLLFGIAFTIFVILPFTTID